MLRGRCLRGACTASSAAARDRWWCRAPGRSSTSTPGRVAYSSPRPLEVRGLALLHVLSQPIVQGGQAARERSALLLLARLLPALGAQLRRRLGPLLHRRPRRLQHGEVLQVREARIEGRELGALLRRLALPSSATTWIRASPRPRALALAAAAPVLPLPWRGAGLR